MEKWVVLNKPADFVEWGNILGVDPVLARIIRNREAKTVEEAMHFLKGSREDFHSPYAMKDMKLATGIIADAIRDGVRMRIIGDYDVDGITSSAILTKAFRALGANVDTVIPHRIHDGYGLNEKLIRDAYDAGVGLIVTCDNGISAIPQIELANELGIRVVVTDHHEVRFETEEDGTKRQILPAAEAIVDPHRYDCDYPFPIICGAFVAYKLVTALLDLTGNEALASIMDELLSFAALGTVCDVMPLLDENRILVRDGIEIMKKTSNPGLRALMDVKEIDIEKLNAFSFGYVIGPCINATGRLDTAHRSLDLLLTDNVTNAITIANELNNLNESRKELTEQGIELACAYVEEHHLQDDPVWIIFLPEVHESIAGIIAGKIRERFNHPVLLVTRTEDGLKGSGRSIEAYNMFEKMSMHGDLFTKYGGHPLAAGFSLREENLEPLRDALNRDAQLTEEDYVGKIMIDLVMPMEYPTMRLAEELSLLEPFGTENPSPLFADRDVQLSRGALCGRNNNTLRLTVRLRNGRNEQIMVFSSCLDHFREVLCEKYGTDAFDRLLAGEGDFRINVAYQISVNSFRGNRSLQFVMKSVC